MTVLLVVLGALAGAPLRLLADRVARARRGPLSGAGTLAVNVAGSALLGAVLGWGAAPPAVLALVGTGFCGTLTTFSTFGVDVVALVEARQTGRAFRYVAAGLALGVGAAAAAYLLTSRL